MIQFFHVYKSYGTSYALRDVSLHIRKGEFTYLIGPSGAGKTTLLKLIFAGEQITRGQLLFHGKNITNLRERSIPYLRRNIGVVFQDFKLLPRSTIEENIMLPLEVLGKKPRIARQTAFTMLKRVGLAHKRHSRPLELSGGEQQRVAIARALVNDPQVLIADEPTGNLDSGHTTEILALLEEANSKGTTVIIATHDENLLRATSKRIIKLREGQIAQQ